VAGAVRGILPGRLHLRRPTLLAVRESGLPARALRLLDSAPRYPEGTALRLQVQSAKDLALVKTLALLRLQN
jgi:hypothetical protein